MAQSAKPPAKSRHSGSSRKPPLIDQKAEGKVQDAEPLLIEKTQDKPMPDTTAKTNASSAKSTQNASSDAATKTVNNSSGAQDQPKQRQKSSGSALLSGVAGGVIALVLGAGLQWAGVLPVMSSKNNDQSKFAAVEAQIASLKSNQQNAATLSPEQQNALKTALEGAADAEAKTAALHEALQAANQNIERLQISLETMSAQNGDPAALNALAEKFNSLNAKLNGYDNLAQNTQAALVKSNDNARELGDLTNRMETLSKQLATPVQGKEIALLMAANALKNAVDRGGSYANELATFKTIAPDVQETELLEKTAALGLPNQTALANEFAQVADAIAATENTAPNNAGFGEQLWASAKGLVATRPIGNVEGSTPAAIAARMEVAIQAGDNEKALSEWQNLPQSAKDVSANFIQKLEARRDVDALLSKLIAMALQKPANNGQM